MDAHKRTSIAVGERRKTVIPMLNSSPCRDCMKRSARCHTICTDYTGWLEERRRHYEPIRKTNFVVGEYIFREMDKYHRAEFKRRKEAQR